VTEASPGRSGRRGVAVARSRRIPATAHHRSQRIAPNSAVVGAIVVVMVVLRAVAASAMRRLRPVRRQVLAERLVHHLIVFIHAALHFRLSMAACEQSDGGGGEQRRENLGGAAHKERVRPSYRMHWAACIVGHACLHKSLLQVEAPIQNANDLHDFNGAVILIGV
jgi:hypothetical protein